MKLVIEVNTEQLLIGNFQTRYFGNILHKKVTEALGLMDVQGGEYDGAICGKPLLNEKGEKIGRIGFD